MRGTVAAFVAVVLPTLIGAADEGLRPPQPRLVTVHGKMPLTKALAEISRQSGVRVEDGRGQPDVDIAIDLGGVPFWQAVDTVANTAGATVDLYRGNGPVTLVSRRPGHRPPTVSHDGLFRFALKRVVSARDLESGIDTCTLFLEAAWEPHLQPLLLETRPQEMRLLDETGKPVAVPAEGSALAPVDGRTSLMTDVQLPGWPRSASKIGLFEGRLSVVGPSKMLTFALGGFDEIAKVPAGDPARQQEQEGVTCRVSQVVLGKDRWTVKLALDYPPGNKTLDSYQSSVVNNEIALVSADGKRRLTTSDYFVEKASPERVVVSYHFRDRPGTPRGRPEDWRLTYRAPAAIVEWSVRFSFKDVPLP